MYKPSVNASAAWSPLQFFLQGVAESLEQSALIEAIRSLATFLKCIETQLEKWKSQKFTQKFNII